MNNLKSLTQAKGIILSSTIRLLKAAIYNSRSNIQFAGSRPPLGGWESEAQGYYIEPLVLILSSKGLKSTDRRAPHLLASRTYAAFSRTTGTVWTASPRCQLFGLLADRVQSSTVGLYGYGWYGYYFSGGEGVF